MRILVADDDRVSQRLLQHLLNSWGHEVVIATDGMEALEILSAANAPMLVLLDWEMPELNGLEVCRSVRAKDDPAPPYIIFVTAKDTLVEMVAGLDAGASDFVRKPFNREELRARIRVGERTLQLQAELVKAQQQMEHLAMYDPLTEVYNRRAMLDVLPRELSRAKRDGRLLAVAIADIDHFKRINDTYGHPAGDAALVAFTQILKDSVRQSDSIGRWGGEEFILVAPMNCSAEPFAHIAVLFERIRERVEAHILEFDGHHICFTVSIGVTAGCGLEQVEDLLQAADGALYAAKDGGRNRIEFKQSLNHSDSVAALLSR